MKETGEGLLGYYVSEWNRYTSAMKYLNHIFGYLNRYWIKREVDDGRKDVYEVYTLAMVVWRDHFFSALKTRLTAAVLSVVERERNGDAVDTVLVATVVKSYISLGLAHGAGGEPDIRIYREFFCDEYLAATEAYFSAESSQFIGTHTVSEYMRKAKTRLEEEAHRCAAYLHPSTEPELTARLKRVMLERHLDTISADFQHMLEDDRREDMGMMYDLLSRVANGLDSMRTTFEKHVQAVGLSTVDSVADIAINDPKVFVETLLGVWRRFNDLVTNEFKSDVEFVKVLDKACRKFVNDNAICKMAGSTSKPPELLAKFVDSLLKKGPAKIPDEAVEKTLTEIVSFACFPPLPPALLTLGSFTQDASVQIHRRQGRIPIILFEDARKTAHPSDFCFRRARRIDAFQTSREFSVSSPPRTYILTSSSMHPSCHRTPADSSTPQNSTECSRT